MRPNLRYDVAGGRERGGPDRDPRRAASHAARRLGDRVRALAPLDRGARARPPRPRLPRRALPRRARGRGAHARPGRLRRRTHAGGRRHDRVRHGHRQARRAARLPRQLPGLARGVRADGRSRRARRRAEPDAPAREPERRDGAATVRGLGRADRRRSSAPSTARCATPTGSSIRTSSPRSCPNATRASSSGCSSRPVSSAAASTRAGCMRIDARRRARRTRASESRRSSIAPRSSPSRAPTGSSRFAETRVCRHEQVAAHFGEDFAGPCGACDVCVAARRAGPRRSRARRRRCPRTSARRSSTRSRR